MVLSAVKNAAKKMFFRANSKGVLTLGALLDMSYVNEVMAKSDVTKIKKNYEKAPIEARRNLSEKLKKIQAIYDQFSTEKDPTKRKNLMNKAIKEGLDKCNERTKKIKRTVLAKREESENKKGLASIEAKMSKI